MIDAADGSETDIAATNGLPTSSKSTESTPGKYVLMQLHKFAWLGTPCM